MNLVSGRIEGLPPTGFYAPNFLIKVEGKALDQVTHGDVLSLKVTMEIGKMTSADIQLNNWDDRKVSFKYSDQAGIFVGDRVEVQLGYADRLVTVLQGRINSLAPEFGEKGASILKIGVLDHMQLLKDRKPKDGEKRQFCQATDGEIALEIANRNTLKHDIDPGGIVHEQVDQNKMDDAEFLLERARRIDYECFVYIDETSCEATLRFGAPRDKRAGSRMREHKFAWGESLISFMPTLTMSNQVARVTVRGWNEDTKEVVEYTAGPKDIEGADGKTGAEEAEKAVEGKQEIVIGAGVRNKDEVKKLAIARINERAYEYIKGKGSIIGLPDLRLGDNVTLSGLGNRFSGTYYVTNVEHTLDATKGYLTSFNARKSAGPGARE